MTFQGTAGKVYIDAGFLMGGQETTDDKGAPWVILYLTTGTQLPVSNKDGDVLARVESARVFGEVKDANLVQ